MEAKKAKSKVGKRGKSAESARAKRDFRESSACEARAAEDQFMARAVELAHRGEGHTRPNPPVGAVVVKDGRIVGEGWHKRAGGDHAEVAALKSAGSAAEGATVYVTLEPCSRPGRVGACTDALKAAKVAGVVYAVRDPNPKNRSRAARVLKAAGIDCRIFKGGKAILEEAEALVRPFAKSVAEHVPYVTVKLAMTLDGRICDVNGASRWISCADIRKYTAGTLRERVDAIMVGAGTVRRDNPSLLSHAKANLDLVRVVVSRSGRLPPDAQIFTDGAPNRTLVFPDPATALAELGKLGIMHVLCEGGMKLAVSMAQAGLVDEWITVLAPKVLGEKPLEEAVSIGRTRCLEG